MFDGTTGDQASVPLTALKKSCLLVQICEKEMKTKAFSKEGLGQSAKQDPRERARSEIRDWLNTTVDTLNLQVPCSCTASVSLCSTSRWHGVNRGWRASGTQWTQP
jgi:Not1 N-terminal domain, CCR4-Not complex component